METKLAPSPSSAPSAALDARYLERMTALASAYFLQPLKVKEVTHWEQLTCVGFNPQLSRLEAVVNINQATGYSGPLCSRGSQEYVRFFVDWGSGFEDVGMSSFKAADINDGTPADPIRHMVAHGLNDLAHRQADCEKAAIAKVRAILSWNVPPPATNPNFIPAYGNVLNVHIQLLPLQHQQLVVMPNGKLLSSLAPLPQPELSSLHSAYQAAGVPAHRLLYSTVQPMLGTSEVGIGPSFQMADLSKLKIDVQKIINQLNQPVTKPNLMYEELTCLGLDTDNDTLGAVIKVKKPTGYSGDLCHAGSLEHVAFWADWDRNGSYDEYLGTATVRTHDIANIPADGLYYCVALHVNLRDRLKRCSQPNVVRIRAVLSWATPPSTTNPHALNYWGNRLDAEVQLRPVSRGTGVYNLNMYSINDVPLAQIDSNPASSTYGLAYPTSLLPSGARPFGGQIKISGVFNNSGPAGSVFYKIEYEDLTAGTAYQPITDAQVFQLMSGGSTTLEARSSVNGWFPYLPTQVPLVHEKLYMLALWNTAGKNGLFRLRISYTADNPSLVTTPTVAGSLVFATIRLDNEGFTVNPAPAASLHAGATLDFNIANTDLCQFIHQNDTVTGQLRVTDNYFSSWRLTLLPSGTVLAGRSCHLPGDTGTNFDPGSEEGSGSSGLSGYSFVANQVPCGYVLRLSGNDRSIVGYKAAYPDSTYLVFYTSHSAEKYLGFAILP